MFRSTSAIHSLFLYSHPTYPIAEAAALLGMEGIETDEGLMPPWAELVSFAMEF